MRKAEGGRKNVPLKSTLFKSEVIALDLFTQIKKNKKRPITI